jgi:hypothetical protein
VRSVKFSTLFCLLLLYFNVAGAWSGQSATSRFSFPRKIDAKSRYLFYLPGRIVEAGNIRPVSERFGAYEYQDIVDALEQHGFVVISEPRNKDSDVEIYAAKVAKQVRLLLHAGVPASHITVVGASQGSWITMFASTYLKNRDLNFVVIAGCSADDGLLKLVNLHGNVLSIYEGSDQAGSCRRYRDDATGLRDYKEVELNTGLRHGFIYRPLNEWVQPTVRWAQSH